MARKIRRNQRASEYGVQEGVMKTITIGDIVTVFVCAAKRSFTSFVVE